MTGKKIILRALEPEDLDFLFAMENDAELWEVSHTQTPFSKHVLKQYLAQAHLDIYQAKQLRLMIVEINSQKSVGMIDLFDFNPQHKRAGIGIVLHREATGKGYASEALALLIAYGFDTLKLHQLYASMTPDNQASIRLFEKFSFAKVGVKKDWIVTKSGFKDELFYQLIHA